MLVSISIYQAHPAHHCNKLTLPIIIMMYWNFCGACTYIPEDSSSHAEKFCNWLASGFSKIITYSAKSKL